MPGSVLPLRSVALVTTLAMAVGCRGPQLIPTPTLYLEGRPTPFDDVPKPRRSSVCRVLYATDRAPDNARDQPLSYGTGRSLSLAFGRCAVHLGRDLTWEELVRASTVRSREVAVPVEVDTPTEMVRFPKTPYVLVRGEDGDVGIAPAVAAARQQCEDAVRAEVRRALAESTNKDAWIYLHGFNNTFDDAVYVLAELWHFMGRPGVALAYSWPASASYAHDRESGEFSVFHLKELLRTLAACPDLHRVHLLAHSRGTDVLTSALRELVLECRGAGAALSERYKIGRVVLAAPDLDGEVFGQRFGSENVGRELEHLTVYGSADDKAIALSRWLWGSRQRLARADVADVPENTKASFAALGNSEFVAVDVSSGFFGPQLLLRQPGRRLRPDPGVARWSASRGGAGPPTQEDRHGVLAGRRLLPAVTGQLRPHPDAASPRRRRASGCSTG